MRDKKGFTIVEMLVVVSILAILVTITSFAASAAFRSARTRRTTAMKQVLQAGLATYYAREGEWPPKGGKLNTLADGNVSSTSSDSVILPASDCDAAFREIVQKSVKTSSAPYLDVSGLYVTVSGNAREGVEVRKNGPGRDFTDAVKRNNGRKKRIDPSQMVFGYPDSDKGNFRRFYIQYFPKTDAVKVLTQSEAGKDGND